MSNAFEMINRELKHSRMTRIELSKKMGVSQSTVQGYFRSKSLKVHRLAEICKAVNYNFFSELAQHLSVDDPVTEMRLRLKEEEFSVEVDRFNGEIERLKGEIDRLKKENETLQVKFDVLDSVINRLGGIK